METLFEQEITKQITRKLDVAPAYLKFIGGFNGNVYSASEIDKMILNTHLEEHNISKLPFDNRATSVEINLYNIGSGIYVTIWDSADLWADPQVLKLYKR